MWMPFRSHLARSLDLRLRSNQALILIVVISAGTAVVLWLGGEPAAIFMAPVQAFLVWGIVREIDPDHQWSALVAAIATAGWALLGEPVLSALPALGLLVAARLITATTGRRPLVIDLVGVAVIGVAVAFTVAGWIAGFGVALALYLDDRRAPASIGIQVAASTITAIGATVVATATGAFPERPPEIVPYLVVVAGVLAVVLVAREPSLPQSRVDARYAGPLDQARLHISRATTGVLVFAMTLLVGAAAVELVPLLAALALVAVSNETVRRGDEER